MKNPLDLVKCPECLATVLQEELDTFGGLCEECSGAFDDTDEDDTDED